MFRGATVITFRFNSKPQLENDASVTFMLLLFSFQNHAKGTKLWASAKKQETECGGGGGRAHSHPSSPHFFLTPGVLVCSITCSISSENGGKETAVTKGSLFHVSFLILVRVTLEYWCQVLLRQNIIYAFNSSQHGEYSIWDFEFQRLH